MLEISYTFSDKAVSLGILCWLILSVWEACAEDVLPLYCPLLFLWRFPMNRDLCSSNSELPEWKVSWELLNFVVPEPTGSQEQDLKESKKY